MTVQSFLCEIIITGSYVKLSKTELTVQERLY